MEQHISARRKNHTSYRSPTFSLFFSISCSELNLPTADFEPVPQQRQQKNTNNPNSNLPIPSSSSQVDVMVTKRATNGVPLRPKKNGPSFKGSPVASPRGSAHGTPNNSPRNSIYRETLKGNADKRAVSSSNVSRLATTSKGCRTTYASPNSPRSRIKTAEPSSKRGTKDPGSPPRPTPPPKPSSFSGKSPSNTNSSATTGKKSKIPTSPPSSATKGNSSGVNTSSHSSAKLKRNHSNPSNNLSVTSSSLSNSRPTSNCNNGSSRSALSAPSSSSSNSSPNSHAVSNALSSPRIARKLNLSSSTPATSKSGQTATASTNSTNSTNSRNSRLHQQQQHRSHHRPGHIPSYLNKSTLSASTGKLNNGALIRGGAASATSGGNRSRPVSRELDSLNGKKSGSGSSCGGNKETVWASNGGFSRPLAPTAKFRSDGEISICAADSPAVEKQATRPQQKNHSGQESGKRASDRGGTIKKESNKSAATGAAAAAAASHSAKNLATASVDSSRPAGEASVARGASVVSTERRARAAAAPTTTTTRSRVAAQSTSNKSASLGAERKEVGGEDEEEAGVRQNAFSRVRSRSLTLFQRIGGALGRRNSCRTKNSTSQNNSLKSDKKSSNVAGLQRHEDWVFFRGFSGKRREDVINDASSVASVAPSVNPSDHRLLALTSISSPPPSHRQRSRTRARRRTELRRTLSLTDAHFIAQAVCEGDSDLIQDLYPDFPRGEPVYPIFDPKQRPRARKPRPTSQHPVKGDDDAVSGGKFSPTFPGKVSGSGESGMSANQRTSAVAAAPSSSSSVTGAGADSVAAPTPPVFQPRKSNGTWAVAAAAPIMGDPHSSWRQQRGVSRQQLLTTAAQQQWNAPPPSVIGAHSVGSGHAHKNNEDFAGGPISHDGVTFSSSVMFVKQQDSHHHHAVVKDPGQASSMGELREADLLRNLIHTLCKSNYSSMSVCQSKASSILSGV